VAAVSAGARRGLRPQEAAGTAAQGRLHRRLPDRLRHSNARPLKCCSPQCTHSHLQAAQPARARSPTTREVCSLSMYRSVSSTISSCGAADRQGALEPPGARVPLVMPQPRRWVRRRRRHHHHCRRACSLWGQAGGPPPPPPPPHHTHKHTCSSSSITSSMVMMPTGSPAGPGGMAGQCRGGLPASASVSASAAPRSSSGSSSAAARVGWEEA
jgi:hypothetical protein